LDLVTLRNSNFLQKQEIGILVCEWEFIGLEFFGSVVTQVYLAIKVDRELRVFPKII